MGFGKVDAIFSLFVKVTKGGAESSTTLFSINENSEPLIFSIRRRGGSLYQ